MISFFKPELKKESTHLFETGEKVLEGPLGKLFSTDVNGEIVIPSAVSGNYIFFYELQAAADSVEENRIIQALENKRLTCTGMTRLKNLIASITSRADTEIYELQVFQPEFLNNFATKSNHCFKRTKRLLLRSSVTVKKSVKLFQTFTKRLKYPQQQRKVAGYGEEWALTHSDLTISVPQGHFDFGDVLSPEAKELIESIQTLMKKLSNLMALCCETLEKEAEIFNDLEQLEWIHNRQFDSIKMRINRLLATAGNLKMDEMSKLRAELPWDEFLRKAYHFFTAAAMEIYVFYQIIMESQEKNIDNDFEKTYLLDNDKRATIRRAIENFDDIVPKGHGGKLPAFYLSAFFMWCGIDCDKSKFYNYFWEVYKGKYNKVSDVQFYHFITLITKGDKAEDYKRFAADMKNRGYYLSF